MQASFAKYWKELRKDSLSESQISLLVRQILGNLSDDDPAWATHVKQALTNKGVASQDIERVLSVLKDEMMDRSQKWGEKSQVKKDNRIIKTSESELQRLIARAAKREENDDHLSNEERKKIVDMWNEIYPDQKKTGNMTDAFIDIIF